MTVKLRRGTPLKRRKKRESEPDSQNEPTIDSKTDVNNDNQKQNQRQKCRRYRVTKERLLRSIPGSNGIAARMARILNCSYDSVRKALKDFADDEEVQDALDYERNRVGDIAEQTLVDIMQQRIDIGSAARTAKWWLERQHGQDRNFKATQEIVHEGGKNPIQTKDVVSIDKLSSLPLKLRRQLLAAMEEEESTDDAE